MISYTRVPQWCVELLTGGSMDGNHGTGFTFPPINMQDEDGPQCEFGVKAEAASGMQLWITGSGTAAFIVEPLPWAVASLKEGSRG